MKGFRLPIVWALVFCLSLVECARFQTRDSRNLESTIFSIPPITRDLHPDPLELKGHGDFALNDREVEIFDTIKLVLTPYLNEVVSSGLVAYDLKIEYSEGEETNAAGIIITNMLVTCVITVQSDSVQSLRELTHEKANYWLIQFFDGSNIYKLLGSLHDKNIDVNEIVFQDEDFRSPLLNGGQVISGVNSDGSLSLSASTKQPSGPGKAAMIAGVFAGIVIICCILLIKYKHYLPWNEMRSDSFGLNSRSGSSSSSEKERMQFLPNSFRTKMKQEVFKRNYDRPPISEIVPMSTDYESRSDRAESVGGDFNVPDEYDFAKKSPSIRSYSSHEKQTRTSRNANTSEYDEFSMPGDYNTVTDEYSIHCHSILGLHDDHSLTNTSDTSRPRGDTSISIPPPSPYYDDLEDEWSFDSYSEESSGGKLRLPSLL